MGTPGIATVVGDGIYVGLCKLGEVYEFFGQRWIVMELNDTHKVVSYAGEPIDPAAVLLD